MRASRAPLTSSNLGSLWCFVVTLYCLMLKTLEDLDAAPGSEHLVMRTGASWRRLRLSQTCPH